MHPPAARLEGHNGRLVRVCVVQPVVPSYRTQVFNRLGATEGIDLEVWAGTHSPGAPDGDDPERFVNFRFRQAPTQTRGPFLSQPAMLKAVDGRFDAVILSWNMRYVQLLPSLIRARRHRVATIVWGHGAGRNDTRARRWVRDGIGRTADACLLYGQSVAARLCQRGMGEARVFVAPNAIDQEPIRAARRWWSSRPGELKRFQEQNGLADREVILFLSRLRPPKRASLLVEALEALRPLRPSCCLVIIGDGPERPALDAQVGRLGLADSVRFVGALYDERAIAPWCLSSAVCAVPGEVGLSILHTFGYGLPVVISDDCQHPEIECVNPGYNGLLFRSHDVADLVRALRLVLEDGARRRAMSKAADATVADDGYSLGRMVDGMVTAIGAACLREGRQVPAPGEQNPG
jgi:glycosyltransferase involved in cell wall biosynthesis